MTKKPIMVVVADIVVVACPKAVMAPLLEVLRLELDHLIVARLEEAVRPLREEVSTVKLWLARVTNLLEHVGPDGESLLASNMAELFGPCSPVSLSPAPMILPSLAEECTRVETHGVDIHGEANSGIVEVTAKILQELPVEKAIEPVDQVENVEPVSDVEAPISLITIKDGPVQPTIDIQVDRNQPYEDVILVEDHHDEPVSDAHMSTEDPNYLATTEDGPAQRNESSSSDIITMEDDSFALSPPPAVAVKRRRKLYDRSSLIRSACIARQSVLRDLGVLQDNGKLDEDKIQEYAVCLKELLPSDLLMSIMTLKGHDFWGIVAAISSHLR